MRDVEQNDQEKCFEAKTCIHNGNQKCGEDADGTVRWFLDSCDLKEYNCLRGTEFVKADLVKCKSLPPIGNVTESIEEVEKTQKTLPPGRIAVINKYWCWRAKYCRPDAEEVCARDLRLNQRRRFKNVCHLYKHNCHFGLGLLFVPLMSTYKLSGSLGSFSDPNVRKNFAEFHCYKLKTCTPGGDKTCAYDEDEARLAEFEDMCTFHRVNCEGKGHFLTVETAICDRQKAFEAMNNITDVTHPPPTTTRHRKKLYLNI